MYPKDPIMLMSYLNTQLRDFYSSLDDLCDDKDFDKDDILARLKSAGITFDEASGRYVL